MTDRAQQTRMAVVAILVITAWTGLAARLSLLHLGDNDGLRARIRGIREVEQPILVGRGRVLDRNGHLLAMDLAMKNVVVDPQVVQEKGQSAFVSAHLARLLQVDPAAVAERVGRPGRRFEYIKKNVPEDLALSIHQLALPGVFFEDVSTRWYPRGTLMNHVVGFANAEGVGSAGIEQRFDKYLRGVPGLRVSEVDGKRREIYTRRVLEIQPQMGADVFLTLDQNLQHVMEKTLDAAMARYSAKGAWAVLQRVRTGEILAMASRPAYDLNEFRKADDAGKLNRPIGQVFEPGSIFKVAVIAAALNEGLVTPRTIIDCENGVWIHNGRPLRDFHPHGRLSVADVLKKSSNIGAAKIAMMLGDERLTRYLKAFGVGHPTGLPLPGEEGGILNPLSRWTSLSISRIAMGHEVAVTSLQMTALLGALANDGFLMRPQLVKRVVSADGRTILETQPEVVTRPIRAETARLMCKLLSRVTEEGGTATRARVENYTVAGKTGTAQKAIPGGYSDSANIASFMGFLPAERPEIALIVTVDEPQPEHTGGVVAAPLFREIAETAVRYLDIPPAPEEEAFRFGQEVPVS